VHLTFLGTAAAEGYPDAFCRCANCEGARAEGGPSRRRTSAAIVNDDLLIDLGPEIGSAAEAHGIALGDLAYGLQTHSHHDHLDALTIFSRAAMCQVDGLRTVRLACSATTIATMDALLGLPKRGRTSFSEPETQAHFALDIRVITPWDAFELGPYRVQSIAANHDPGIEAMLFAIEDTRDGERLFYGTDTGSLPDDTWPRLGDLCWRFDTVVFDFTFGFGPRGEGHMNREQVQEEIAAARAVGVIDDATRIVLTHIAHHSNPPHRDLAARLAADGWEPAYDGLTLDVRG
jgi:phosphoribosyl 1,2-cyclic phosphate phosphodiesterase